jgi:hypothetical protein
VNISLRRRFRGFTFTGGGVFSTAWVVGGGGAGFSRLAGFLRVVRFIVVVVVELVVVMVLGMERLCRRDLGGMAGVYVGSDMTISSVSRSSSSSEASVSEATLVDSLNGASKLSCQ